MLIYSFTHKLSALCNALLRPSTLFQTSHYFLHGSLPGVGYLRGMQREKGTEASVHIQNKTS